jgi:2-polyprenyl-3-methyl-5-hydroxy-6-metoxy-1,4-benzoquinol methylase
MADHVREQSEFILSLFNRNLVSRGLEWGCGTAPSGFELAKRGNTVDFVDVPGGVAQKFIKFRADKHGIKNYSFNMNDEYDWILFLDSIEHMHPSNAEQMLTDIIARLKPGGSVVTNYFNNRDFDNAEHIFMQHDTVKALFEEIGLTMVPIVSNKNVVKNLRWVKA